MGCTLVVMLNVHATSLFLTQNTLSYIHIPIMIMSRHPTTSHSSSLISPVALPGSLSGSASLPGPPCTLPPSTFCSLATSLATGALAGFVFASASPTGFCVSGFLPSAYVPATPASSPSTTPA